MTASYSLRALAQSDLEDIWLYTLREWGVEQADDYLQSLFTRFTWLANNPLMGRNRDDIKAGYRCFPEGRHLIFYIATDNNIDIIGIVHQSMNIIDHLADSDSNNR